MRPRRLRLRPLVFRRDRVSADWACLYYKVRRLFDLSIGFSPC